MIFSALVAGALLIAVPDDAGAIQEWMGLPPGVRGTSDMQVYTLDAEGQPVDRTATTENRFVAHIDWSRGEHTIVASDQFGGQLHSAMVVSLDRTEVFQQGTLAATVWDAGGVPGMGAVAQASSPIEHPRLFHQLETSGATLTHTRQGELDVYEIDHPLPGGQVVRCTLYADHDDREIRRAELRALTDADPGVVIRFLDWQPIVGTAYRHPTRVETTTAPIGNVNNAGNIQIARVAITGVLAADAPPEYLELGPEVRVTNHLTGNVEDGTGKVLGSIDEFLATNDALAARSTPRTAGPGRLATYALVAGGAVAVIAGALLYRERSR